MQQQIDNLQKQIDALKSQLTNSGMSMELRENIRNEVVQDFLDLSAPTQNITLSGDPQTIVVPQLATHFLIIKFKDREFKVPYYENI